MKAILLCAGQGSRLRPLTNDCPKGMVQVGGQSILERQIILFRELGIDDIVVIGGYRHETIPGDGITKLINTEYETTNMVYSLFCAASEMAEAEAVVVSYGDILYSRTVLNAVVAATHSVSVVVDLDWYEYFSKRSDDVLGDAESLKIQQGRITDIGRRVSTVEEIEAQYIGLMKFDQAAISTIARIFETSVQEGSTIGWGRTVDKAYMTDLLQEVVNQGGSVHPVPIRGGWCEIDTLDDFALAEVMLPAIVF